MSKSNSRNVFEKGWKERFESFAENSDDDAGIAGWSPTGLDTRLRQFKYLWESHKVQGDNIWLDAGCGAGTYTRFIASQGVGVVGMDYSFLSLQKAVLKSKNSISWCAADVTKLPVKQDIFDGVMCFGVTQALESSSTVVQNLSQSVKCGGQVWIDALNGWCLPNLFVRLTRWIQRRPMHLRYESHREIYVLMENNGLINIELHWLPILPARLSHLQWAVETHFAKWLFRYMPFLGLFFSHAFILCGERKHD